MLGRGAVVLLITDGLDRDDPERLEREIERLQLSARRVIWLNPLLRWDGFEPKASGHPGDPAARRQLPPCHDLASLEAIAAALAVPEPRDQLLVARSRCRGRVPA